MFNKSIQLMLVIFGLVSVNFGLDVLKSIQSIHNPKPVMTLLADSNVK